MPIDVPALLYVTLTRTDLIYLLFFVPDQIARQQQQLLQQQHKINLLQQQIQVSECVSLGPLTLSEKVRAYTSHFLHSDYYNISPSSV